MKNPHFDDGLLIWNDKYSGRYEPPPDYSEQFDLQWKLAMRDPEFNDVPGASIADEYIEDRIYEWTGNHPRGNGFNDLSMGSRVLDHPLNSEALIKGKECIDIGCGMGRWSKVMLRLGAKSVLSIDMSEHALISVRKFSDNVRKVNIMEIPKEHPDLVNRFDFANFWGVAMCTHDPCKAFKSAASTVKKGGSFYLMVYAPEGQHATALVNTQRKLFVSLKTLDERLSLIQHIVEREWDWRYPFIDNIKNIIRRAIGKKKATKMGVLDMLEPFYNWTIPLDVIHRWMKDNGFTTVQLLNEYQKKKIAYHILGQKG
jgi:SAM-dependent methyltransferase